MNIWDFVGGLLGGAISSSAICLVVANLFKDRWIEKVKAGYAAELENIKDSLTTKQKALQAQLDHGNYVTQAQYDLELSSYKDIWGALSEIRIGARAFRGIQYYELFHPETSTQSDEAILANAFIGTMTRFRTAHNDAVATTERVAPFYAKDVQRGTRSITFASGELINELTLFLNAAGTPETWDAITARIELIAEYVETADELIRERLSSLRLLPEHR